MAETPSFSTLSTKQKVIGILTLVIFAFIIYEVFGLFSSGSKSPAVAITPTPPSAQQSANKQPTAAGGASPAQMPGAASASSQPMNELPTVSAITPPKEPIDRKEQQQQQKDYLESVNQLQLLKVRRDIAETNQAIATARLATETANKSMSDLLTQPALPPQMPASMSEYVGKLGGATASPAMKESVPPVAKPAPVTEVSFIVISVSMEFNRWSAILGVDGKMYSVSIGDTLFDGSTVVSINKNGVVLMKEGKKRKISIQSTI